jgi:hypothetical protein
MNVMTKRLEAIEKALAKVSGDPAFKLAHHADGETEEQAKTRAGLGDWDGPMIYIRFAYSNLPQYQAMEGAR